LKFEMLACIDSLAGMVTSTKKQRKKGLNPEFLQELQIPVMEPTMSSRACFQLWDYDKAGLVSLSGPYTSLVIFLFFCFQAQMI